MQTIYRSIEKVFKILKRVLQSITSCDNENNKHSNHKLKSKLL
jgi:hypothetical protein